MSINYNVVRSAVSKKQLELLVSYLERHPEIANNKLTESFTVADRKKALQDLALHLNAAGPCRKPPEKWSKTWIDYKCNVKKKASSSEKKLTALEKRVIALIEGTPVSDMAVVSDFDESSEFIEPEVAMDLETELSLSCSIDPTPTESVTPVSGKRKLQETSSLLRKQKVTDEDIFRRLPLLIESNKTIAENLRLLADRTLEGQQLIAEMSLEGQRLQAEASVKSAEIISNAMLAFAQALIK